MSDIDGNLCIISCRPNLAGRLITASNCFLALWQVGMLHEGFNTVEETLCAY